MFNHILLPVILAILTWGFWISPNFSEISAGIAIFLFGMLSLEQGFQAFTGGALEKLLKKTTNRLWKSLSFGIISTSIMQSSSLVSVITISFLGAGLIGLKSGLGIIYGANIGTTTGAWLVAAFGVKVKLSAYAMPLLVFGVLLLFQKAKWLRGIGYVLSGLGFLFLGIHHMKEGFAAFKDTIALNQYALTGIQGLVVYTFLGLVATVIMQSSHATLVLIITALAAHQITYENAIALAIGANIGTTITAVIGAMSSNIAGKRLAAGHLIFNVVTAIVALVFIYQLIWLVDQISILLGISSQNYSLQLAVFHTIFNTLGVLLMLPFLDRMTVFLMRILKEKSKSMERRSTPHFLNQSALAYPDAAARVIQKECMHLLNNALEIMARIIRLKIKDIRQTRDLEELMAQTVPQYMLERSIDTESLYHYRVKGLYNAIIEFALQAQQNMPSEHIHIIHALKSASKDIVSALKHCAQLQSNIQRYIQSPNPYIRAEYNLIRLSLASWIQHFDELSQLDSNSDMLLLIDKMQYIRTKRNALKTDNTEALIREKKITIEMATSLINDNTHVHSIGKDLIRVASYLYIHTSDELREINEDLTLENTNSNQRTPEIKEPGRKPGA